MIQIPYEFLGKVVVFFLVFLVVASLCALVLGLILLRKGIMVLPQFVLFFIDSLHFLLKRLLILGGLNEKLVDQIGIEIRNRIYEEDFEKSAPDRRILVFPQCLRNPKCPAPLTRFGIQCKKCGLCVVGSLKEKAESAGYKVYIVPGGSFVKRIVQNDGPSGALGVACGYELNYSMMEISRVCPVQGVPLLKDGCYCTKVDEDLIVEKIFKGIERKGNEKQEGENEPRRKEKE